MRWFHVLSGRIIAIVSLFDWFHLRKLGKFRRCTIEIFQQIMVERISPLRFFLHQGTILLAFDGLALMNTAQSNELLISLSMMVLFFGFRLVLLQRLADCQKSPYLFFLGLVPVAQFWLFGYLLKTKSSFELCTPEPKGPFLVPWVLLAAVGWLWFIAVLFVIYSDATRPWIAALSKT